jgi:DnaJ-class molecular chaperone
LGLESGASDGEIKKAYYNLSRVYHPDKNKDPEANKYFVDYISKAYQALTDPVSKENYDKYGHPDGRQVWSQSNSASDTSDRTFVLVDCCYCKCQILWLSVSSQNHQSNNMVAMARFQD